MYRTIRPTKHSQCHLNRVSERISSTWGVGDLGYAPKVFSSHLRKMVKFYQAATWQNQLYLTKWLKKPGVAPLVKKSFAMRNFNLVRLVIYESYLFHCQVCLLGCLVWLSLKKKGATRALDGIKDSDHLKALNPKPAQLMSIKVIQSSHIKHLFKKMEPLRTFHDGQTAQFQRSCARQVSHYEFLSLAQSCQMMAVDLKLFDLANCKCIDGSPEWKRISLAGERRHTIPTDKQACFERWETKI